MATQLVRNVVKDSGQNPIANSQVRIYLVAGPAGAALDAGAEASIGTPHVPSTSRAGYWAASLQPNAGAGGITNPTGTYYRVVEPSGATWTIQLNGDVAPPVDGWWVGDPAILVQDPVSPPPVVAGVTSAQLTAAADGAQAAAVATAATDATTKANAAQANAQSFTTAQLGNYVPVSGIGTQVAAAPPAGLAFAYKRAVDPRAYGLTGGVDDSTALAACFAAAAGGAVEWPQLQINTRGTLTIPDHTEIRGSGPKGSILATDQDIVMLRNVGGEEISLKNLKLSNSVTGARTNYDIEIINPFKPVLEHLEIALSQAATGKGGIHIFQTVGQPGDTNCFMPQLTDVWIRNGVLVIEDVTDGKVQNCYMWGTYTGAAGTVQLTRASNWTFENVDIVPPQGDAGGYLIGALSNLSIIGGLMDGSYDTIMTGHGIKSSDFVRGLSVTGVKFYNLGRSGVKITDIRRSSFVGNIFVQNNKADSNYPDIDLYSATGNTILGNTHGAPNTRTNKGLIYREDGSSSDNVVDYNNMEYDGGSHFYAVPVASWQSTSYLGRRNRPDVAWPWSGLQVKSSDYTITKDDLFNDQEFHGSAAITFTLPSAGSVHAGNKTTIKNTGTGVVTVQTVSFQTIDGLGTSLTLAPNRSITIESNGSGWQIIAGKSISPSVVACPLAMLATVSATAWPTANLAIFQRITIPEARAYRYVTLRIDGQSGNYQVAVVRLSGTGLTNYTRVMNSGVIAVPTAGDQRIDLGATMLSAGEYAIAVWFDNITATTRVASNSGVSSSRLAAETSGLASGVPSSSTLAWASTRFIGSLGLEADV